MCSHESPRGDRRCLKEEFLPLFVLFVLFGQAKRTLKEKNHKDTFLLSYFSVTKSTKSHQRERSPLFENLPRVHEFVARAMRGECVRQWIKQKSAVLPLSAISYYHACEHIARDSRADSCTHCLHARYKCRAGVDLVSALTGVTISLLQWGIDRFAEQTRSASPRLGQKVARFTATDEVLSYMYYQNKPYLTMFAPKLLSKAQPRGLP